MNQEEFNKMYEDRLRIEALSSINLRLQRASAVQKLVVPLREDIQKAEEAFWAGERNGLDSRPFLEGARYAIEFILRHNR